MTDAIKYIVPWDTKAAVPVADEEIARIESAYGAPPDYYKTFLKKYGASDFDGIASLNANGIEYSIAGLFGSGPMPVPLVASNFDDRDEAMPMGVIAIGKDPFGGLFLLRPEDGAILHWDNELDPSEVLEAVQPVASSFSAFLEQISVEI